LVIASTYLSEYDLRVFQIPRKKNFTSGALSRLEATESDPNIRRARSDYTVHDDVLAGVEALIALKAYKAYLYHADLGVKGALIFPNRYSPR
jgi:hypothetical protein